MSVSKICDTGHRVVFESTGGYIEHLESNQNTEFDRKGGVYALRVRLDNQDFP